MFYIKETCGISSVGGQEACHLIFSYYKVKSPILFIYLCASTSHIFCNMKQMMFLMGTRQPEEIQNISQFYSRHIKSVIKVNLTLKLIDFSAILNQILLTNFNHDKMLKNKIKKPQQNQSRFFLNVKVDCALRNKLKVTSTFIEG